MNIAIERYTDERASGPLKETDPKRWWSAIQKTATIKKLDRGSSEEIPRMRTNHIEINASRSADQETFRRQGYLLARALLEPPLADFLWSYVHTMIACRLLSSSGDLMVPNTLCAYGDPAFDGLLEYLRSRIEESCGLRLSPTYSYFRLYKHGDTLKRHRDRPACEISVSLNIGQVPSDAWPLFVEGNAGPYGALLSPGDALLYRGIDLFHWREPFHGNQLVQVFLHYVDRDGPHAAQKFDGRISLMRRPDVSN